MDAAEVAAARHMVKRSKACNLNGSIPIVLLPKELQPALRAFDLNCDGTIDPLELGRGAELYSESQKALRRITKVAFTVLAMVLFMICVVYALAYTVAEVNKDTETGSDGVMRTRPRGDVAPELVTVGVASFAHGLSSDLPDAALDELQRVAFTSDASGPNVTVSFNVLGWARLPALAEGASGAAAATSEVSIYTNFGTLTLEGAEVVSLSEGMLPFFSAAGFLAEDGDRHRVLLSQGKATVRPMGRFGRHGVF